MGARESAPPGGDLISPQKRRTIRPPFLPLALTRSTDSSAERLLIHSRGRLPQRSALERRNSSTLSIQSSPAATLPRATVLLFFLGHTPQPQKVLHRAHYAGPGIRPAHPSPEFSWAKLPSGMGIKPSARILVHGHASCRVPAAARHSGLNFQTEPVHGFALLP